MSEEYRQLIERVSMEIKAQWTIVEALGGLDSAEDCERVLKAVSLILEADKLVPGILGRLARSEPHA